MRKPTLYIAIALLALAAVYESCSKKGGRKAMPHQYDVYAVGYEENVNLVPIATLWKNGESMPLAQGPMASKANSVFVSGHDVYVAGFEENISGHIIATLWKNGTPQSLTKGTNKFENAYSVSVSGQDVYVAGKEQGNAVVWKNGEMIRLSKEWSEACSIHASGEDVYVAGWEEISPGKNAAILWKNSLPQTAKSDDDAKNAPLFTKQQLSAGSKNDFAYSVFASGSVVYVAGQENVKNVAVASLWTNGKPTQIGDGRYQSVAFSVFASGKNSYVVGVETGNARITINGSKQFVSRLSSWAYSVFVVGKDVYVAGSERGAAVLWINGKTFWLTDVVDGKTKAEAKAVFVL
jgi:hypothetical protein